MKISRIYVDTSVIGGCFDIEFARWSNGLFMDFKIGNYIPVVSDIVAAEIEAAPSEVLEKYAELISYNPEMLKTTDDVIELADSYIQKNILSKNFLDDARHIALATIHDVDLLVSWNFRHIVHYDKIRMFNSVNIEKGYKTIQIYSPREVTNYGDEDNRYSAKN